MRTYISYHHLSQLAKRTELRRLFATYGISSVALAFVSAFGPIYLYRSGYTIQEILIYFSLTAVFKLFALPIVFKLFSRIGTNKVMAMGIMFFIINFGLFATLPHVAWPLWLFAMTKAIANAAYYAAYRMNFAIAHSTKHTGEQAAKANVLILTLGVAAPLVGGVIASLFNVAGVYIGAIILFIAAMLIIVKAPQEKTRTINFAHIPRGRALKDYAANYAYSYSGQADLLVWPLLISFIIPSYAGIGAIGSLFVILSILVALTVGKVIDKRGGEKRYIVFGMGLNSVYNIGRVFATTTAHLVGLGLVSAVSGSLISSAYDTRYYTNAKRSHWIEYLFAQEIANSLPWLFYFPILLVVSLFLSIHILFLVGVVITIPAILGISFINFGTPKVQLQQA